MPIPKKIKCTFIMTTGEGANKSLAVEEVNEYMRRLIQFALDTAVRDTLAVYNTAPIPILREVQTEILEVV